MRMATLILAIAVGSPGSALAVGEGGVPDTDPVRECRGGFVWDEDTKRCVLPKDNSLSDDARFDAARAYAYVGQPEHALTVLAAMTNQNADRVLTYKGFAHRKAGRLDLAQIFYAKALAQNPNNNLARSYRAQGYVEAGHLELARAELTEIRRRGGRGTWAEISLRLALDSGAGFSY